MLWKNGKKIAVLMQNGIKKSVLWRGGKVIWMAVRSCFGSGIWKSEKPWLSEEKWKNNK